MRFTIVLALGASILGAACAQDRPSITKKEFGKMPDGTVIEQYTLKAGGATMKVITLGGIITELSVPDKTGKVDDVVLGFDNLEGYLKGHPYFGAITGRYANRIAKGKFTLDGKEYTLATNNGKNHLHGGKVGFDKVVWKAAEVKSDHTAGLELTRRSPDGEEGYPGNLDVLVRYTLTDKHELVIDYEATTDKATPINLTNHTYFNLAGIKGGDILGHELMLNAENITPTDDTLITTGKIAPATGTPFDFRSFKAIGKDIAKAGGDPIGYDLNYVINRKDSNLVSTAWVREPRTGRTLEVYTTEPGIQFYTGNFLDGTITGKGGVVYKKHFGFCLETQHYPDSPNKPDWPSTILRPGKQYRSTTMYRFGVDKK
jgi:aldose 1-epimerase